MRDVTIISAGVQATVQDAGRIGYEQFGVAQSGAFDAGAWAAANEAVGNDTSEPSGGPAAIEVLLGGFHMRAHRALRVACAGAHASVEHVTNSGVTTSPTHRALDLVAGDELRLPRTKTGLRSYLAVSGGFDVPGTLGSRSYDSTAALGPAPLRPGDGLTVGRLRPNRQQPTSERRVPPADEPIRLYPGPHCSLFAGGLDCVTSNRWTVRPESSRAGVRLGSDGVTSHQLGGLPSVPTMPGTVQLLPNGEIAVFGPDGPTTGGYPFIAFVDRLGVDRLSQLRPGAPISFVEM